jgi:hypothetical protein
MTIRDLRWPASPRRSSGSEQADQRHRCSRWATKPQPQATIRPTTIVAMSEVGVLRQPGLLASRGGIASTTELTLSNHPGGDLPLASAKRKTASAELVLSLLLLPEGSGRFRLSRRHLLADHLPAPSRAATSAPAWGCASSNPPAWCRMSRTDN